MEAFHARFGISRSIVIGVVKDRQTGYVIIMYFGFSCLFKHTLSLSLSLALAESVPTAVYAFLHCSDQSFEEMIPYTISLGGDADTIASMAGKGKNRLLMND